MTDNQKVEILVGLVQRKRITVEQIKDDEYRAEVSAAIEVQNV